MLPLPEESLDVAGAFIAVIESHGVLVWLEAFLRREIVVVAGHFEMRISSMMPAKIEPIRSGDFSPVARSGSLDRGFGVHHLPADVKPHLLVGLDCGYVGRAGRAGPAVLPHRPTGSCLFSPATRKFHLVPTTPSDTAGP